MHIPDGYLSPQTYIPLAGVFVAVAAIAVKNVKKEVSVKNIPYLGMASAFSFIIMMFNLPLPGGTTGHAVGSALISIIFGPWASILAVSVTLIIQALLFGDGGITALGANCFNMAIVMSFAAYFIFKIINFNSVKIVRIFISAFIAGYLSLVIASVFAATELGIQPIIASTADGKALYSPYKLSVTIPAIVAGHLLLFGIVEGLITALIVRYFAKTKSEIYAIKRNNE